LVTATPLVPAPRIKSSIACSFVFEL
jgi:hypothetical protein